MHFRYGHVFYPLASSVSVKTFRRVRDWVVTIQ